LVAIALWLMTAAAQAAGQGLTLTAPPLPRNGSASIQVEVTHPQIAASIRPPATPPFQALIKAGRARVTRAEWMPDTGETVYTLLAIDASASFQPHRSSAIAIAHAFVDAIPSKQPHKTSVLTFGVGSSAPKEASTTPDAHRLVDAVKSVQAQPATRLKSSISEAVQAVASAQPLPSGIRQVIVFTDAGEESRAYSMAAIIKQARATGVRVHVVVFRGASQTSPTFAQYRDELRQLAEGSGGYDITVQDVASASASVATVARASEATWRLTLSFCDVPRKQGSLDDELTVELLQGSTLAARSEPYLFQQQPDATASEPCATSLPCASGSPCPSASTLPTAPLSTPPPKSSRALAWIAIATTIGLLLAAVVGWILTSRRRKPPIAEPTAAPSAGAIPDLASSPSSTAVPSQVAYRVPTLDPFAVLPETRLIVVRGWPSAAPYFRVSQPVFHVGAREDMNVIIDLDQVSGHHTLFELQPDGALFVTDAGSTNGTFVDGVRLAPGERRRVGSGQCIGVSRFVEFRIEQPTVGGVRSPSDPSARGMLEQPASVGQSAVAEGPAKKGLTVVDPQGPWKGRS
jgi:pSer/pThr/pTyr-binding forkhead associated (FHA) protein